MSATPDKCFFLTTEIVLEVQDAAIAGFGGSLGLRDRALLESAVAAPQATFGGESVYTDLIEIGAAYLFDLCRNHPFIDGNKRVGHAAMETFLVLNGWEIHESVDEQEAMILRTAAGSTTLASFTEWLKARIRER